MLVMDNWNYGAQSARKFGGSGKKRDGRGRAWYNSGSGTSDGIELYFCPSQKKVSLGDAAE